MKIFLKLVTLIVIFFPSVSFADGIKDALNKVYQKSTKGAEGYINNLFSGPGETEVSIMEKNADKTEASIMLVRPLKIKEDNVLFYQGQVSQYYVNGTSRQALNLGLGYRILSEDGSSFTGINAFYDVDSEENDRLGFGGEFRTSSFELNGNYYHALSDDVKVGNDTNRALSGHDIILLGQVPYLPWADLVYTNYEWEAEKNSKNSEGEVYKGQFNLTKSLTFEAGLDDNNITKEDNFYRLTMVFPAKERPTLIDNLISKNAFENSDVREEMLTKVKRSNRIVVEVEASGVVISNGNS